MTEYRYLEQRPEKTRQQLYLKGRVLPAAVVFNEMLESGQTPQQAADDWGLPLEAVLECIEYCKENLDLLHDEAVEEHNWMTAKAIFAEEAAARSAEGPPPLSDESKLLEKKSDEKK